MEVMHKVLKNGEKISQRFIEGGQGVQKSFSLKLPTSIN